MNDQLPHDSDGDALRRLIATGSDLSREMEIDFAVDLADKNAGEEFAAAARAIGFQTRISQETWTCYCSRTMVPTYEAIIAIQKNLEDVGRAYNAKPDGWGSFGNAPDKSETT